MVYYILKNYKGKVGVFLAKKPFVFFVFFDF